MEEKETSGMMVNPNQVWFPHALYIRKAESVIFNQEIPTLPYITLALDVVSDVEPKKGEIFTVGASTVVVESIVEERPARGDWSGAFWNKVHPVWYRCFAHPYSKPR